MTDKILLKKYKDDWQKNNREKVRGYNRKYERDPKNADKIRARSKKPYLKYKESGKIAEWSKRSRLKNKYKIHVVTIANNALRRGKIKKMGCSVMGIDCFGQMEMHHEDYDKPLEIIWYCYYHHRVRHRELNDVRRERLLEQNQVILST